MQKYERLYYYIHEYQHLLYDFYSKSAVPFLCTYLNFDIRNINWEDEKLLGGPYEWEDEYSTGLKRNKILLLPVFFIEEYSTAFDAQDIGYVKINESSCVIPSTYGFIPYPQDVLKPEQSYMKPTNDTYPCFTVTGVEILPNTDRRFWRLKLESATNPFTKYEAHTSNVYSYVDYDKKIHSLEDSQFMAKLLSKNEELRCNLKTLFDERSGFYYI
jgi:hypothetical protein